MAKPQLKLMFERADQTYHFGDVVTGTVEVIKVRKDKPMTEKTICEKSNESYECEKTIIENRFGIIFGHFHKPV